MPKQTKNGDPSLKGKADADRWTDDQTNVCFGYLAGITSFARYRQACIHLCYAFDRVPLRWRGRPQPTTGDELRALGDAAENLIKCRLWAVIVQHSCSTKYRPTVVDFDREGAEVSYLERRLLRTWNDSREADKPPADEFLRVLAHLLRRRTTAGLAAVLDRMRGVGGFGFVPTSPRPSLPYATLEDENASLRQQVFDLSARLAEISELSNTED